MEHQPMPESTSSAKEIQENHLKNISEHSLEAQVEDLTLGNEILEEEIRKLKAKIGDLQDEIVDLNSELDDKDDELTDQAEETEDEQKKTSAFTDAADEVEKRFKNFLEADFDIGNYSFTLFKDELAKLFILNKKISNGEDFE